MNVQTSSDKLKSYTLNVSFTDKLDKDQLKQDFMNLHKTIYIVTIFVSAFLLFLIQPMIAKLILPQLGGSPSVWQTVMLFFQSLLLLGYAYVCYGATRLTFKQQKITHLILTAIAVIFLPLSLYLHDIIERTHYPVVWLFISLIVSVGMPFFILSANAPLLQRWFSLSEDKSADNPYFLYSASNIGSLLALLSYPILIEPFITLSEQTWLWSFMYVCFAGLLFLLSYITQYDVKDIEHKKCKKTSEKPTLKIQLHWAFLSFIPSSLMLGLTTYLTTDVASFPLLWILPLALYLLSFILVFANGMPLYKACFRLAPAAIIVPFLLDFYDLKFSLFNNYLCSIALYLGSFFIIAMMAHGRLSLAKPKAEHLTYFYMWMSIGGALGGLFNAVLAPYLFIGAIEYYLILCISVFAMGHLKGIFNIKTLLKNCLFGGILILLLILGWFQLDTDKELSLATIQILMIIVFYTNQSLQRSLLIVIAFLLAEPTYSIYMNLTSDQEQAAEMQKNEPQTVFRARNFFGISEVTYNPEHNAYKYYHGTTFHGGQFKDPRYALRPGTYYHHLLTEFKDVLQLSKKQDPIAVTGLGVGTLTCFASNNQEIDLYEIDPIVIDIAQDDRYFTYLRDCEGQKNVILGDARLKLQEVNDNRYGIMFLDAYSSDSLPIHLLTDEAFQLYLNKLKANGILAFNITNRHLNLKPVLAKFAQKYNLKAYRKTTEASDRDYSTYLLTSSEWVIMARSSSDLPNIEFLETHEWEPLIVEEPIYWTDNFSSILPILK